MSNVVQMPSRTPLDEVEGELVLGRKEIESSDEFWFRGSLRIMDALMKGRAEFRGDKEFGHWLLDKNLGFLNDHDRAALLQMGAHKQLTERVLRETDRRSYRWIWELEVSPRVGHVASAETMQTRSPVSPVSDATSDVLPEPEAPTHHEEVVDIGGSVHIAFKNHPRGEELSRVFQHPTTRAMLARIVQMQNKAAGKDIYALLLWSLDQGFITETHRLATARPSLRLLFPQTPKDYALRFDITKAKDRKEIRERILPAAAAQREALLANPQSLQSVVQKYWASVTEQQLAQETAAKLTVARQSMNADEEDVIVFGHRLWPQVDAQLTYTYAEVCAAAWTFRDWANWMARQNDAPKDIAIRVRRATRWLYNLWKGDASLEKGRKVLSLITQIATYYEQQPDGEVKYPTSPKGSE